jgi:hypothetical protein
MDRRNFNEATGLIHSREVVHVKFVQRMMIVGAVGALMSSCIVRERVVPRPLERDCPRAVWVEGFRGPYGRWHPGHWECHR